MNSFPLLSTAIFSPLIGIFFILITSANKAKYISLFSSVLSLILCVLIFNEFDSSSNNQFQLIEHYSWFSDLKISFYLGIDSVALWLILLTAVLLPVSLLCSFNSINVRQKEYYILFLLLEILILGAFSSLDLFMFYVFFEAVLIPIFFIIGIWGGENRIYASYKFFLYTLLGSVILLIGIICLYNQMGTADITEILSKDRLDITTQKWLWLAFFTSFAIKTPMWPFHTWLPNAHVEAPTAGSVILAGVLLKMGGYGFLRFSLPMFPEASIYFRELVYVLSVIAIIYSSLMAFAQTNMKKMIAYSSVAHMGYVTLGIFSGNILGIQGAVLQMVSHGVIAAGLFLSVGILYEQTHTKDINQYGGVASVVPKFAFFFMLFVIAQIALPGTSAFIGEIYTLIATYQVNKIYAILAVTGMVLTPIYMLSLYAKVMYGKTNPKMKSLKDIGTVDLIYILPLILIIIVIGISPGFISNTLNHAIGFILR